MIFYTPDFLLYYKLFSTLDFRFYFISFQEFNLVSLCLPEFEQLNVLTAGIKTHGLFLTELCNIYRF